MGHDSDQAALIYQHATRDADRRIADALSMHIEAERRDQGDGGLRGIARPGELMAHQWHEHPVP